MMLDASKNDPGELRVIIDVLVHRLRWTRAQMAGDNTNTEMGGLPINTSYSAGGAEREGSGKGSLASRLGSGAAVWVLSPALGPSQDMPGRRLGSGDAMISSRHPTELQCPPLSLVQWHSAVLADTLTELQAHWASIGLTGSHAHKADPLPKDVRLLPGEYEVWQEVRSHEIHVYYKIHSRLYGGF